MDEKILKQIKTTCPFPLYIYTTSVKYNEVKKASGIAYILLDLIQKADMSNEKITDVLLKFGIPQDMHYIFGNEIANLISTEILTSNYEKTFFTIPKYFKQLLIDNIQLTLKGEKIFKDGFIPTGVEKVKVRDIYFSPVTRRFDIESKLAYTSFESSFLGEEFLDRINIDISGMEDYINSNSTKIGLKAEERMISFEFDEPKKMQVRKEDGMTIIIKTNGVEFNFDTTDETAFFYNYYTSENMTKGLLAKNKYKFVDRNKEIIFVPTVNISELDNISNLYIPDDAQKQASRPCKIFVNKNRLGVNGIESSIKLDLNNSINLLNYLNENAEFALIDKSGVKFFSALNVNMPCVKLNDYFEIQLLVEKEASKEQFRYILNQIYNMYFDKSFNQENGKIILFIVELLDDISLFKNYLEKQLECYDLVDEKIDLALKINNLFKFNSSWNNYFKEKGFELIKESSKDIRLDNMIYKKTVLSKLKNEIGLSDNDFISLFADAVKEEESSLVFEALEAAGFDNNLILGIVNMVEIFINQVINRQTILSDTNLAIKFKTISKNLWDLNDLLGINSYYNYTLNDNYNVDNFFNIYSTLKNAYKDIEKYSKYANKGYDEVKHYFEIYDSIHELLSIERTSSSHPEKITEKYIDDIISKGKYKEAISDLLIKLQYDLRKKIDGEELESYELIDKAKSQSIITKNECDLLHNLRKVRNGYQHPERNQISFAKNDVEEWKKIVFKLGG